jgi:hypothetical protein
MSKGTLFGPPTQPPVAQSYIKKSFGVNKRVACELFYRMAGLSKLFIPMLTSRKMVLCILCCLPNDQSNEKFHAIVFSN